MIKPDRSTILITVSVFMLLLAAMIDWNFRTWLIFAGIAIMIVAWATKK